VQVAPVLAVVGAGVGAEVHTLQHFGQFGSIKPGLESHSPSEAQDPHEEFRSMQASAALVGEGVVAKQRWDCYPYQSKCHRQTCTYLPLRRLMSNDCYFFEKICIF